ncbi:hypothetical protein ANN_24284 [Periplaneta americana]|uniref:Uncharacterized protein n=1 Tax=Periplaneta americana TaxID=6978 RepID=A0ABQ8S305_PERAM|nr:hypothetical protein ANN_24284 [Periplaneta americana]
MLPKLCWYHQGDSSKKTAEGVKAEHGVKSVWFSAGFGDMKNMSRPRGIARSASSEHHMSWPVQSAWGTENQDILSPGIWITGAHHNIHRLPAAVRRIDVRTCTKIPGVARIVRQCCSIRTHFSLDVRRHLNATFPGRWIGRDGTAWPPRSPDLNPLDFYLWGT